MEPRKHLGARSVSPLCLARRGLGMWGNQRRRRRSLGSQGTWPRAAKETGQEVAAWASLTDINQQSPSSSANAASRSFQVVHQGTSLMGPVVRTHASTPVDTGLVPGQRTRIPHATWYSKKKKKWLINSGCKISAGRSTLSCLGLLPSSS